MIYRSGVGDGDEISISKNIRITGTGAITQNVLQVFGSVRIIEQYAIIKFIASLENATNVYYDAYDGVDTELLALDGAVLSGCVNGSLFLKDQDITQALSVMNACDVSVSEIIDTKKAGKPFTITQKCLCDTFVRLQLETTEAPVDFTIESFYKFQRLGIGSNLVFV